MPSSAVWMVDGRAGMSGEAFSSGCLFCSDYCSKNHHKREEEVFKMIVQVVSSSQWVLQPLFCPERWRREPKVPLLAKGLAGCLPSQWETLFPSGHAEVLPGLWAPGVCLSVEFCGWLWAPFLLPSCVRTGLFLCVHSAQHIFHGLSAMGLH